MKKTVDYHNRNLYTLATKINIIKDEIEDAKFHKIVKDNEKTMLSSIIFSLWVTKSWQKQKLFRANGKCEGMHEK